LSDVTIAPTDSGPYLVEGRTRFIEAEGTEYRTVEQMMIFLCRCGGSSTQSRSATEPTRRSTSKQPTERWRNSYGW
jgi:hypothetical protein